jgi:hypothetical protein
MRDYSKYYNLEAYLFDEVGPRFRSAGQLELIDFYFILTWKTNRAKNVALQRIAGKATSARTADAAVLEICTALTNAADARARLQELMHTWDFRLATASAILAVLYPDEFTVYDIRVCEALDSQTGRWTKLADASFSSALWNEYLAFKSAVEAAAPQHLNLRDKDRYLWGKSFYEDASNALARFTDTVSAGNSKH